MNVDNKYIARIIFKNRIYESEGNNYENLFCKVMYKSNKNFLLVKPYGNSGDMKNDGFDRFTGTYYQIFAPENVLKPKTINETITKLTNDFNGLKNHWEHICPIKNFYFVINDKYKGVAPQIHQKIMELDLINAETKCELFPVSRLEDVFINLNDDDICDVIAFNVATMIDTIDYDILTETIEAILKIEVSNLLEDNFVVPDFDEKIKFNSLSNQVGIWLVTAGNSIGDLERYLRKQSSFLKKELQNKFRDFYNRSKSQIPDSTENCNDRRFIYILEMACYNKSKAVRDSVLILMACFFETCDIFEEPEDDEI